MNTCIPKLKSDLFLVSPVHDTELIIPADTILPANWHADIPITNIQPCWEIKIVFSDSIPGIPGVKSCMWKVANANTIPGQDGMIHIELAVDYDGWISLLVFSADRQLFTSLSNGKMPQAPIEVIEEMLAHSLHSEAQGLETGFSLPSKTNGGDNGASDNTISIGSESFHDKYLAPQNPQSKKQSTFAARIRVELAKNNTTTTDDPPPILDRILSKSSTGDGRQTSRDLPLADSGPLVAQSQNRCTECDAVMPSEAEACPWCSVPVR